MPVIPCCDPRRRPAPSGAVVRARLIGTYRAVVAEGLDAGETGGTDATATPPAAGPGSSA